jgi:Mlc titration factor MtfA (ptsG expression regulator)|tara:strand:+ start:1554 stop:1820 length:267 start_codon:yes stop_codon:yes gene_type:complete
MSYLADLFSVPAMKTWELLAFSEMEWIQKGQNSFFRAYGGTHIKAFFSVAAEKKFEASQGMSHYNYKLYDDMCLMLNQNSLTLIYELD